MEPDQDYSLIFETETHHATYGATRMLTINIHRFKTNEDNVSIPLEFATTNVGSLTESTFTILQYTLICQNISTYLCMRIAEKTSRYVSEVVSSLNNYEQTNVNIILHLTHFNPPSVNMMEIQTAASDLESEMAIQTTKDEYEECTICMDMISEGQDMNSLQCGHIYHHECITNWVKINESCPLCRETI
ncbi:unnamed protein product [Eruca vesicaria subsp. sativa]|uniref:RING-type E3 ubiquitin transferase n=1 Tax=Eruca vesicaria subsp. sativa TaxID=29727 RepID=A0ABC8KS06_ERUVS|nr:unnamed protein product [Eruca vesicaria subsp. sativa]